MPTNIYIRMAEHPQVILDTMDKIKRERFRRRQQKLFGYKVSAALFLLGVILFLLDKFLRFGSIFQYTGFILWCAAIAGGALSFRAPLPSWPKNQFEAARRILYTLRDDTGRKGRVVGWLDLTGPMQPKKRVRTARSRSGKKKQYYRDPWFKVKIKLADGNLLRLTFVDIVKRKAGSIVDHRTNFTAKLVYNPSIYKVGHIPQAELPLPGTRVSISDGIIILKAGVKRNPIPVREILETLKAVYERLEPLSPLKG